MATELLQIGIKRRSGSKDNPFYPIYTQVKPISTFELGFRFPVSKDDSRPMPRLIDFQLTAADALTKFSVRTGFTSLEFDTEQLYPYDRLYVFHQGADTGVLIRGQLYIELRPGDQLVVARKLPYRHLTTGLLIRRQ